MFILRVIHNLRQRFLFVKAWHRANQFLLARKDVSHHRLNLASMVDIRLSNCQPTKQSLDSQMTTSCERTH
jgi:hypothetical protein